MSQDESRVSIPVIEERLRLDKHEVEMGRVRIRTKTENYLGRLSEELERERIAVERVPVDREVSEPPSMREENGVLIIPIFEEVLVVEKRLVLKEELHVHRERTRERLEKAATLKRTRVEVQREKRARSVERPTALKTGPINTRSTR